MSQPISTYSFLPWLRQGIANKITEADLDDTVKLRASVRLQLDLTGTMADGGTLSAAIPQTIHLYGPGDIVGIDSKAVVKTEPRDWVTNFEPNYLPYIDFYHEDFPWRYTPAAPDTALGRLRPWIALVVLKEGEFDEGKNLLNRPLPYIECQTAATAFPPATQLWAWAHVHVNRDLGANADEIVSSNMAAVLAENPDLAYSRIMCPRKLDPNAAYHAFLMPVFETGRLAGLGLEPEKAPNATHSAWADYPAGGTREDPTYYPYYYRWCFRTGTVGDFEYLVRLLQPKPVDGRVGRRDIDVQEPGADLHGITNPELGGVLRLGGALQIPEETLKPADLAEVKKYEDWDQPYPHAFQNELAEFINLADDYTTTTPGAAHANTNLDAAIRNDPDPLITAPLYGRWHALTQRLLKDRQGNLLDACRNWVHELNLDPRFRVAAGFGTHVVQINQEAYMDAAWEQVGQILEANRRIRLAQLATAVSTAWYEKHLKPLAAASDEKALLFTAPVHRRVVTGGLTIGHQVQTSVVPAAALSAATRRIMRPGGRLVKSLPFEGRIRPDNLIGRINAGEVAPARPKGMPAGAVSVRDVAEALLPRDAPRPVVQLLRGRGWLRYLPLLLALVIVVLVVLLRPTGVWLAVATLAVAGLAYLAHWLWRLATRVAQADSVLEGNQTPATVDRMPKSPNFVLASPGDGFVPAKGNVDSPQAARFKEALKGAYELIGASKAVAAQPAKAPLDLSGLSSAVVAAIDPAVTIPRRTMSNIALPKHILALIGEQFQEAMAYPEIDTPMYKPLVDISADMFLPNINFLEQNSITLLETNQRFIEAYMVGLNHEFARELLWREYPTDQRGSYFRQFWDVSSYMDTKGTDPETLREKLKDIPPLHKWPCFFSELGQHDQREAAGEKEEEVVLVIRGELLKKYPTAVIYAHRARWQYRPDHTIDITLPRQLVDLTGGAEDKPPPDKVKTPLYQAKVEPDIYFFGFDLTAKKARGESGQHPGDDPGWFFVIKERPGEPRFGLDIEAQPLRKTWSDLSWEDVLPGGAAGAYIQIQPGMAPLALSEPPVDASGTHDQWADDVKIPWDQNTNAAHLAYILYQTPVLVAVHASEMLPTA